MPIKHVKKDCGIHWGLNPGSCSKCSLTSEYRRKGYLQYGGTPFVALLGDPVEAESIQERAIRHVRLLR